MSSLVNAVVLTVAALLLGSTGAYLLAREVAPFEFSYGTRSEILGKLTQQAPPVPPSLFGAEVALEICEEAMGSLTFRLSPQARAAAVAGNCAEAARRAIEAVPSGSYAHYLEAQALFHLGEIERARAALERSQATGPNEQWIAERRVALAERQYEEIGDYAANGHLKDLALLAQSRRGIRSIASRYVASPDFRTRVTEIVETLPNEVQSRFLTLVRAEARNRGAEV